MKTRMQQAFEGITDEQARLVAELLSGFVEDAECSTGDQDFDAICPPAKIAMGTALLDKLDAAMASYAEEAN